MILIGKDPKMLVNGNPIVLTTGDVITIKVDDS